MASHDEFFNQLNDHVSKKQAIDFYDKYAENYDKHLIDDNYTAVCQHSANVMKELFERECKEIMESGEPAAVLDVGCGSGLTGMALQKAGFKVFDGVDPSQGMLDIAHGKKIYRNLLRGKITDSEKINLPDEYCNLLFCIGCIGKEHIRADDAIPEFLRLLKPGGLAVYSVSPSLDKLQILEEHLPYFKSKKFEMIRIEKKYYRDGEYCDLYFLKKT